MRLTWIATLVLCTTAAFVCGAAPDDAKPPDVTLSLYTKDTTLPDYANCQMVVEVQNNGPEEISISGSIEKEHTLSVRNDSELPRPGLAADASLTTDGYTLEIRAYQAAGYWPFISVGNTGRVPPDLHVSSGASLLLKIDRGYDLISPGTNRIRAELMNDGRLVAVSNVIQVDGVDVPDTQPIPTDFFIIGHGYDLPLRPDSSPMGDARAIAQRDSVSIEIVAEYEKLLQRAWEYNAAHPEMIGADMTPDRCFGAGSAGDVAQSDTLRRDVMNYLRRRGGPDFVMTRLVRNWGYADEALVDAEFLVIAGDFRGLPREVIPSGKQAADLLTAVEKSQFYFADERYPNLPIRVTIERAAKRVMEISVATTQP
jgi:hypothetical protein